MGSNPTLSAERNTTISKIDFTALKSKIPKVKYGCVKNLMAVAEENPAGIYPDLEYFVKLLDDENRILNWMAIVIIGHLARVDKGNKIDGLTSKLFTFLHTDNLVAANHAITALGQIALAKPEYRQQITTELLKVEGYNNKTEECRNIAIGTVILAISSYIDKPDDEEAAIGFVRRQLQNTRDATRKKAERFLKKHVKSTKAEKL